jgi:hypothetical protein
MSLFIEDFQMYQIFFTFDNQNKTIMALSKSSLYYRSHPKAKAKKDAYNTDYEDTPERKRYRSKLQSVRVKRKLRGSKLDLSHTRSGKLVLESRSKNRGRQGADGRSTLK